MKVKSEREVAQPCPTLSDPMDCSRGELYTGAGLSFSPPVDHVWSELSAMTHPSRVALHNMTHSFTELLKPPHHEKAVIQEAVPESVAMPYSRGSSQPRD